MFFDGIHPLKLFRNLGISSRVEIFKACLVFHRRAAWNKMDFKTFRISDQKCRAYKIHSSFLNNDIFFFFLTPSRNRLRTYGCYWEENTLSDIYQRQRLCSNSKPYGTLLRKILMSTGIYFSFFEVQITYSSRAIKLSIRKIYALAL